MVHPIVDSIRLPTGASLHSTQIILAPACNAYITPYLSPGPKRTSINTAQPSALMAFSMMSNFGARANWSLNVKIRRRLVLF